MKQETKALIIKYSACFGIASLITLAVFWIKGFFTDDLGVNIQILSDGFFVSGVLFFMVAGLLYVSGEGGLIGIGFVLRNVILFFIPMGRTKHELYKNYRERKLKEREEKKNVGLERAIMHVGLAFLAISVIFSLIWYFNFYGTIG